MSSKMLIDSSHPEETRVVVLKGNRVEEFDFESASKRQLRGNIYLAKVTRVEPSLQAAFIDYGGNRHGFLAFSEIHPDYYQIPHADRQALLDEEARAHRDDEEETRGNGQRRSRRHRRDGNDRAMERRDPADERITEAVPEHQNGEAEPREDWAAGPASFDGETDDVLEAQQEVAPATSAPASDEDLVSAPLESGEFSVQPPQTSDVVAAEGDREDHVASAAHEDDAPPVRPVESEFDAAEHDPVPEDGPDAASGHPVDMAVTEALIEGGGDSVVEPSARGVEVDDGEAESHEDAEEEHVEQIGGDALEDAIQRAPRPRRHYKIQEVIKRRQILLIQVVKEERGNKGAALTTYLSLAGRYSVLMPNTARGGGISRKITDSEDRKRLKSIAQELEVPEGMGIILRTAGASRAAGEVMRDFEYLLRMWESVRELTLKSTAPSLVYEEGSLIKRSIRDLYTRDVEEVIVSGEAGYQEARDFMRLLMPSAAKSVQLYRDPQPILAKSGAEAQLDAMFSNHVTLKSGGYLVINQTEALVAIDVNSGRSTREHNIEDTALRTNLEAADEVARQLRLRDLAGLIVVDFIDMEEGRNNRAVERRIKEALKNDRARIQIGRISHFGLLEMSRQRMRTGVLEGSTVACPHCAGAGSVRSMASIALHVLRLIEDQLIRDAAYNLVVRTRSEVALYILNQKRSKLNDLESRFGVSLTVAVDDTLTGMVYHAIQRGELATPVLPPPPRTDLVRVDSVAPVYDETAEAIDDDADIESDADDDAEASDERNGQDRGGNGSDGGRRRKRRRRRRGRDRDASGEIATDAPQPSDAALATMAGIEGDFPTAPRLPGEIDDLAVVEPEMPVERAAAGTEDDAGAPPEPPRRRRSRRNAAKPDDEVVLSGAPAPDADDAVPEESTRAPKRRRVTRTRSAAVAVAEKTDAEEVVPPSPALAAQPEAAASIAEPELPMPMHGETAAVAEEEDAADLPADQPSAAPDPDRPKRSGWWQRAKATFGS